MKTPVCTIAAVFFVLIVLTTFIPYPAARADALAAGFNDDDIDIGLQLSFERRLFFWGSTGLELALLCIFAMPGFARRSADRLLAMTGQRRLLAALLFGLAYWITLEILTLPIGIARYYHARHWEMSNLELSGWLRDHLLYFGIYLGMVTIALVGFYTVLIVLPRIWWVLAPIGMSILAIVFAFLMPIVISPLFNDFTPLDQTKWKDQTPRVQALIAKAGIPVREILVMNASRQGNHTNAYFAGFGPTRRIVLYDTLLKNHSPAEIESVLAHEIGHWQEDHIVKGILLGTLAAIFGCFVLDRLLRFAVGRAPWHLQSPADPAGLPLILLLVFLGSWATMPVQNAVSRYFEREADQASLRLADHPDVFTAVEQKMARDNKSNVAPTPWNVWLFASHPSTVERIRAAKEWQEKSTSNK
jgi:STE24 endopeptidase